MTRKIYKDREGNKIGTLEYLQSSYLDLMLNIGLGVRAFRDETSFDTRIINDKINIYLAVRSCYDGDTSSPDRCINKTMKETPDFAKHIDYKPIK